MVAQGQTIGADLKKITPAKASESAKATPGKAARGILAQKSKLHDRPQFRVLNVRSGVTLSILLEL
jgi:hypothetical protein